MTEITGVLRDAYRIPRGEDVRAPCLGGDVYGDIRGRFRDGERITTSTIMAEDGDIFTTRYSVYRVESWRDAKVEPKEPTNTYDKLDTIRRKSVIVAGPIKLAAYTVADPDTREHGGLQFHMTYDNTVMAVMGESAAKLFAKFINDTLAA